MSTPDLRTVTTGVDLIPVVGGRTISQRVGVVLPPCDAAFEACSSTEGKLFAATMLVCGREEACLSTEEKLFTASMHTCGRKAPPVCRVQRVGDVLPSCDAALKACSSAEVKLCTADP